MPATASRRIGWALAALLLLAAALRLATLGAQSLWFDEALTRDLVREPFGRMLSRVAAEENTPPLSYALTWASVHAFGTSEATLRLVAALCGTATVGVAFALGRALAGARAALLAAALVATSPLLVWFSQEARSYALLVLLTAIGLLCAVRAARGEGGRWLAGWAAASGLAVLTHYFSLFPIGAEAVWLLLAARAGRVRWAWLAGAFAGVAVALAVIAPTLLDQEGSGRPESILTQGLARRLAQVPKQFLVGYDAPATAPFAVVAALLLVVAAVGLWRARRRPGVAGVLVVAATAVLVPMAAAVVGADFLNTRNVLAGLVPVLVLAGVGFAALRGRLGIVAGAALALVGLVVCVGVAADARYQRTDWRGLDEALGARPYARALLVSPDEGDVALGAYRSGVRPAPAARLLVREIDVAGVAVKAAGSEGATPPRPAAPPPPPPGFAFAGQRRTSTYTLVRYRSPVPRPVDPARIAPLAPSPPSRLVRLPAE